MNISQPGKDQSLPHGRPDAPAPRIEPQKVRNIIERNDTQTLVTEAEQFGRALKVSGLTKSQIRSIFGTAREIEASWVSEKDSPVCLRRLLLLQPRLAYQQARQSAVKPLSEVLTEAIRAVAGGSDASEHLVRFRRFMELFEAILAYHTAAGGK
jgi:CRISPR-associated protein Csm2